MAIRKSEINSIAARQKGRILEDISAGKSNQALLKISYYASLYYWAPIHYSDGEIENSICEIAGVGERPNKKTRRTPDEQNAVFIDSFGFYSRGLAIQYLTALSCIYNSVHYIYTGEKIPEKNLKIFLEKNKLECSQIPCGNDLSSVDHLSEYIESKNISVGFFHIAPWSTVETVFAAKANIMTYLIDITDHTFWLGSKIFDKFIGFREYGKVVADKKRGISSEKYSILKFYPVNDIKKFQGLPEHTSNKIKIMLGGAEYKILGGNGKLLKILAEFLKKNLDIVIIFLGELPEELIRKIMQISKQNEQVVFLGFRHDVKQTIAQADIFVPTSPWGGGLLTQYAIANRVPIVALEDRSLPISRVDDLVLCPHKLAVTFEDEDAFLERLETLCRSQEKRAEVMESLNCQLPSRASFYKDLCSIIYGVESETIGGERHWTIDYKAIEELYLNLENGPSGGRLIISMFRCSGFATLIRHPILTYGAAQMFFRRIFRGLRAFYQSN